MQGWPGFTIATCHVSKRWLNFFFEVTTAETFQIDLSDMAGLVMPS